MLIPHRSCDSGSASGVPKAGRMYHPCIAVPAQHRMLTVWVYHDTRSAQAAVSGIAVTGALACIALRQRDDMTKEGGQK